MKKLMFAAAIVAAVSFASCGNKEAENADTVDTLAAVEDTAMLVAADSQGDTIVAEQVTETAVVADQPAAKK